MVLFVLSFGTPLLAQLYDQRETSAHHPATILQDVRDGGELKRDPNHESGNTQKSEW
jgi:sensor domain CHASE-containing protein